jgi:hypothetical protein
MQALFYKTSHSAKTITLWKLKGWATAIAQPSLGAVFFTDVSVITLFELPGK